MKLFHVVLIVNTQVIHAAVRANSVEEAEENGKSNLRFFTLDEVCVSAKAEEISEALPALELLKKFGVYAIV